MKKKENKNGKNVVVEDGHDASFRDIAGNLKNIYADDGSLTEEGKKVMSAREHLAKILNESEDESKTSARNRILIISAVLIVAIVLFFLFFHISLLNVRARESYDFKIYLKSKPTFSNTFITHDKIKALLDKYDNASESERILIYNDPFVRLLLDKHILDDYHNTKQLLHDENINDESREQVIQISATALYDAYNSNAAAADNKYTGKTLIVTGYVFEITKNYDGIYFVILDNKGADGFSSTFCYFPASRNSSLTSLQKGQFLSIKGKCIGRGTDNIFPKLENCTLEGNFIQENYEETNQHESSEHQYEFYYNFAYENKFQLERIKFPLAVENYGKLSSIKKDNWKHDPLFPESEYYTDIYNSHTEEIDENEKTNKAAFSWIYPLKEEVKNYYFIKESDKWYLTEISVQPFKNKNPESFIGFLHKFMSDSTFQKSRIKFPLNYITIDFESEDMKEITLKLNPEDAHLFDINDGLQFMTDLSNSWDTEIKESDNMLLTVNGKGNGIYIQFFFNKLNKKWYLTKVSNMSN